MGSHEPQGSLRLVGGTMRALRKVERRAGAELVEIPVPSPREDEVLVRVHGASICGTDLHIYEWNEWAETPCADRADDVRPRGGRHGRSRRRRGASPAARRVRGRGNAHRLRALFDMSDRPSAHLREPADPRGRHRRGVRRVRGAAGEERVAGRARASMPTSRRSWSPSATRVHATFGTGGGEDIATNAVAVIGCGPIGLFAVGGRALVGCVEGDRDRAQRVPASQGSGDGRRRD